MHEVKLPELGENIERADVAGVMVRAGDTVERDQPLIEVETEKATLEVPAPVAGVVSEVLVASGDTVGVGQVIVRIDDTAAAGPPAEQATSVSPAEPAPDRVEAEPTTDQPAVEAPERVVAFPAPPADHGGDPARLGRTAPAAPSVRRLARELGVAILDVKGSGPGGRISADDVKAHAKRLIRGAAAGTATAAPGVPALPDFSQWGEVEYEPLSKIRRVTARNMATAWSVVPHVTQHDRADITQLETMRKKFNQRPEARPAKLTMTALVIKTVASALRQFPKFNASLDLSAERLILKRYVHIGVAVDTERGLLVPVIRDVDHKSVIQIAAELDALADKARDRKLAPDQMTGGSFTVSNLGGLGTTYFAPIVAWPQVAILGVGRAGIEAVWEDDAFQPRRIMPLSVSYDHRIIDGADAARFLRWIAEALEQPLLLLLDE